MALSLPLCAGLGVESGEAVRVTYTDGLSLPLCAGLGVESGEAVRVTYTDGHVPPSLCWSWCRVRGGCEGHIHRRPCPSLSVLVWV